MFPSMRKIGLAAAGALVLGALALTPAPAAARPHGGPHVAMRGGGHWGGGGHWRGGYGRRGWGGFGPGIVGGLALGAALGAPYYYDYGYPYGYYPYDNDCYIAHRVFINRWGQRYVRRYWVCD